LARRLRRLTPMTPVRYAAALGIVGITIIPLVFVVIGGFRTNGDINSRPMGWPEPWTLDNYSGVLFSDNFWTFLFNSLRIAAVATAATIILGAMASFALSRYEFPGRERIYGMFTAGLLFPLGVAALPVYLILKDLGLVGHWSGVVIAAAAFGLPTTIIILRPFMQAIPRELEEASALDGASKLSFFWRILLPLCAPALVTVGVLAFVASWNGYLLPLLVFSSWEDFTLPLGTATFQTEHSQDTASIFAFTSLSMVPAIVFFLFAQKRIVNGLTGAVKM
jgi:raffinose/stachyose/melibiose transport system permease protein